MWFGDLFCKKTSKFEKTGHFYHFSSLHRNSAKFGCFSHFWEFYAKQFPKSHKIRSFKDDMRKILSKKFWSQGTSLGSMGPLTQRDVRLGFHQLQILVIWGPYRHPDIVACQGHAKTPKLIPWLCVYKSQC